ncbi:universal stress protein [Limosilactobacillus pontis]|uniref:Universal stress protein UspA n=1 Tax=Limosilactobacillus pontis DSM 8475 TaxID=1423794 RepID=A0A922TLR2_9LACO|nr:universal stress protein [Limosilactobacillus pontis]KRM35872.1 universal stress protein UspA [Limosilactobacillus pontis DSM 8475]QFV01119.1 universal stress protein [Limosilactobacillus pontis]
MSYQKILVGIDGSTQSDMAFNKAVEVALQNNAQLNLLSVINGERYPSTGPSGYGFVDHSIYESAVEEMKKRLGTYQTKAEHAGVKDVKTDVVIGATGLNVVGRLIVGSTAAYTIREAPCDVTVVKTDMKNKKLNIKKENYPEI